MIFVLEEYQTTPLVKNLGVLMGLAYTKYIFGPSRILYLCGPYLPAIVSQFSSDKEISASVNHLITNAS